MQGGQIKSADYLDFHLSASGSGSTTDGSLWRYGASLISYYTYHPALPPTLGVSLEIKHLDGVGPGNPGGGVSTKGYVLVPDAGINWSSTISESDELLLRLAGWQLHSTNSGGWQAAWSGAELFVNGVSVLTKSAGGVYTPIGAPSYIPLLGIPPEIGAGGSFAIVPDSDIGGGVADLTSTTPGSSTSQASGSGNGGWRYQNIVDGTPVDEVYPVNFKWTAPSTSSGCGAASPALVQPTNTNTWNGSASGSQYWHTETVYDSTLECDCPDRTTIQTSIYDIYKGTNIFTTNGYGTR